MATDISPKLLEAIRRDFNQLASSSAIIRAFPKRVASRTATQADVQTYSSEIGRILGKALSLNIGDGTLPNDTLYWNIAKAVVDPLVRENHRIVNEAAVEVQKILDEAKGLGLNAIAPVLDEERLNGLLENACVEGLDIREVQNRLNEPVRNITEYFFDTFIKENASFRHEAGLEVTLTRKLGGKACEWCRSLEGVYDYNSRLPDDIYRRHERCRCTVTFDNGRSQDVWSKRYL